MSKKKILFAVQNLNIGGIQKAFVNLAGKLAADGRYDITVFAFTGGALRKELPEGVRVYYGNRLLRLTAESLADVRKNGRLVDIALRTFSAAAAKLIGAKHFYKLCFRKQKEKYDIAVSYFNDAPKGAFNKGTNQFVANYVTAGEKIAFIHTDPILGGFNKKYCRNIYKPFDKIICVSDAVREKFNAFLPDYADKTITQRNVFDEKKIKRLAREYEPFEKSKFDIVTVARIDNASKRIDGIINICCQVKRLGLTGFKWRIVGDGPDLKRNIELAKKLGVDDIVIFEGEKTNPYPYIYNSDLFALFSAYEGYPLVIGEALILKTPVLTTNYAAAKEQIPKDRGIIAESDGEFLKSLTALIRGH